MGARAREFSRAAKFQLDSSPFFSRSARLFALRDRSSREYPLPPATQASHLVAKHSIAEQKRGSVSFFQALLISIEYGCRDGIIYNSTKGLEEVVKLTFLKFCKFNFFQGKNAHGLSYTSLNPVNNTQTFTNGQTVKAMSALI